MEIDLVSQPSPVITHQSPQTQNSEATFHNSIIDSEQHHFMFSKHVTPVKPAAACEVEAVGQVTGDEITLKMVYHTGTSSCEIKFPFNLGEDTATDVVSELVKENLILAMDEGLTRRRIEETIRAVLIKQRAKRKSFHGDEMLQLLDQLPPMPLDSMVVGGLPSDSGITSDSMVIDTTVDSAVVDQSLLDSALTDTAAYPIPVITVAPDVDQSFNDITSHHRNSKPKFKVDPIADFCRSTVLGDDISSPVDESKTPTPNNLVFPQPLPIYQPSLSAPIAISTPPRSEHEILNASLPLPSHNKLQADPEASRKHQELSQKLTQLQEFNLKVFDQDSSRKPNRSFTTPPTPPPQHVETKMQEPRMMSLPNPLMNFGTYSSSNDGC